MREGRHSHGPHDGRRDAAPDRFAAIRRRLKPEGLRLLRRVRATAMMQNLRPSGRLYVRTASQGRGACLRPRRQRAPTREGAPPPIGATGPSRRSFTASSRNTTRRSSSSWPGRAGRCRTTCSRNSRLTSSAVASSTGFFGCVASPAMSSTWSPSAASGAGSAPVAGRGAWPRARHCSSTRCFPSSRCGRTAPGPQADAARANDTRLQAPSGS